MTEPTTKERDEFLKRISDQPSVEWSKKPEEPKDDESRDQKDDTLNG